MEWLTIKTIFGSWCIDLFGKENGELIYDVYRNILDFRSKRNRFVQQKDNIINDQKNHISFLLENTSKEIFIKACKSIKKDYDSGCLKEPFKSPKSFRNFVLSFNIKHDSSTEGFIYVVKHDKFYKIGKTINIEDRLKGLQTASATPFELITSIRTKNYHVIEKQFHKVFENKHVSGEWFNLSKEDIEFIKNYNGVV